MKWSQDKINRFTKNPMNLLAKTQPILYGLIQIILMMLILFVMLNLLIKVSDRFKDFPKEMIYPWGIVMGVSSMLATRYHWKTIEKITANQELERTVKTPVD